MKYDSNQSEMYMNRAQKRQNGIKNTPKAPKRNYSHEELECIIKKELTTLINEPYSETLKRQRYQRLQPFIETYQKQPVTTVTKKKETSQKNRYKL